MTNLTEVMPQAEDKAAAGAQPADATKVPGTVDQEEVVAEGLEAEGGEEGTLDEGADGAGDGEGGEGEGAGKTGAGGKKPLTPEERIKFGLTRRVGRLTNERARLQAEVDALRKQVTEKTPPKDEDAADDKPHLTEEDVERRARALAAQTLEQQKTDSVINTGIEMGRKSIKDFDSLVKAADDAIDGFFDERGNLRPLTAAIFDADKPHELIRYLAENPDTAAELADMSPLRQVRRVAQIEIEMGKVSPTTVSRAPKPITPSRGTGAVQKDESKMTDAEWFKAQK
jgi:hypothetical protein